MKDAIFIMYASILWGILVNRGASSIPALCLSLIMSSLVFMLANKLWPLVEMSDE